MGDRYYIRLEEKQKNKKLFDLLDTLEFNQAVSGPKQIPGALPRSLVGSTFHSEMWVEHPVRSWMMSSNYSKDILLRTFNQPNPQKIAHLS